MHFPRNAIVLPPFQVPNPHGESLPQFLHAFIPCTALTFRNMAVRGTSKPSFHHIGMICSKTHHYQKSSLLYENIPSYDQFYCPLDVLTRCLLLLTINLILRAISSGTSFRFRFRQFLRTQSILPSCTSCTPDTMHSTFSSRNSS